MAGVKVLGLTVLCAIAALVLPVAAGANVYCVDATPGLGDNNSIDPQLQRADRGDRNGDYHRAGKWRRGLGARRSR